MMHKFTISIVLLAFAAKIFAASEYQLDLSKIHQSSVRYQNQGSINVFPIPVIALKRSGLALGATEINEIKDKIIYPLINNSDAAISSIIIEWYSGQNDSLGLSVIWANGDVRESIIPRTMDGHYNNDAYKILFARPTP